MRQLTCSLGVVNGRSLWPAEPAGHWRRVSPAERAAVREAVRAARARGLKRHEIAKLIGNTSSYVDKIIEELGLRMRRNRPRGMGPVLAAQARAIMRAEPHLTKHEVAKRVDLGYSHLIRILIDHKEPSNEPEQHTSD